MGQPGGRLPVMGIGNSDPYWEWKELQTAEWLECDFGGLAVADVYGPSVVSLATDRVLGRSVASVLDG